MSTRDPLSNLANVLTYFNQKIDEIDIEICSRNGWTDEQWGDFLAGWCKGYLANRGELVLKDGAWRLKAS